MDRHPHRRSIAAALGFDAHGCTLPSITPDPQANLVQATQTAFLQCPHCGEQIEVIVDCSAGDHQQYVEDCSVCCCPIVIAVTVSGSEVVAIDGKSEDA